MARMFAYIAFVVVIAALLNGVVSFSKRAGGAGDDSRPSRQFLLRHPGVVRLGVVILILLAWEIAARWFIDPLFISPPSRVFASLGTVLADERRAGGAAA